MPYLILFAHHDANMAGSTISLGNILAHLDRTQFTPRVLLAQDGPAREYFQALGVAVDVVPAVRFGTSPGPRPWKLSWLLNWRAFLPNPRLYNYLKTVSWDLLHINDKAFIAAGLAARKQKKPIVWYLRSSYFPTHSRLNARVSRDTIRSIADQVIAISEDEIDGFEDFAPLDIIHNSVDFEKINRAVTFREETRHELGLQSGDLLIGQVSTSIGEVRGTWDFLRACGRIYAKLGYPGLKFVVVAAIPERDQLRPHDLHPLDQAWQIAREENIADRLTFTGYRKDALNLMAAMDVVVVCNRHGVLGRMPFEAMACGRPLVATAGHSGKSRVVVDQETVLIVPPKDSDAIAAAVCKLIGDAELSRHLVEQGPLYAREHFDPEKNARLIEEIYQKLLTAK